MITTKQYSTMVFTSTINEIINSGYDISNLNKFAEEFSSKNEIKSEDIIRYVQYIESIEGYPVEESELNKLSKKPVSIEKLKKLVNLSEEEFTSDANKNTNLFTYEFFKRYVSLVDITLFANITKLEYIVAFNIISKSVVVNSSTSTSKPKNIIVCSIVKSVDNDLVKLEMIKLKESKLMDLPEQAADREIIYQFSYDKDEAVVKPFSDELKHMFMCKVDIIDRKKEREVESENIKIKESLDNLNKEERKVKEKELLVKHTKVSMKSLGVSVKSSYITYPVCDEFDEEEILTIIKNATNIDKSDDIAGEDEVIKKIDNINDMAAACTMKEELNNLSECENAEATNESDNESDDGFGL